MKIGITEAGDAALDYTWLNKIDNCDGLILITKNVTDKFIEKILKYEHKIILHATCTGMGGTIIEPNVPTYEKQLAQVTKLIEMGFPTNQIVIRVDPIIPTTKGLQTAQTVIDASPVKHFRISMFDAYTHVRNRFKAHNIVPPYGESFQPSNTQLMEMKQWLAKQPSEYIFECCAEPKLADLPNVNYTGCVSENDIKTLGITTEQTFITGIQRRDCLCLSCKTELLSNKKRCPHNCLYCYWKD